MLVYRDHHHRARGQDLVRELTLAWRRDAFLGALLRAAELECALADREHPHASTCARLSDVFAEAWLADERPDPAVVGSSLASLSPPDEVLLRTPEGFAYYALQPGAYAELALELASHGDFAIVGVRSIGTCLSAVVSAALRRAGRRAERITVRPTGHPFARQLALTDAEHTWIARMLARRSTFVVVDEGPGMSGSTFLAVGEALQAAGVPCTHIHFACSHLPDPARLVTSDGPARWKRFHTRAIAPLRPPEGVCELSGGRWRALLIPRAQGWPAVWASRERIKWLSADGRWLHKFEGLSPYGDAAFARARQLAEAGVAPPCEAEDRGFVRYARIDGRPARAQEFDLEGIARYCALRTHLFASGSASAGGRRLDELVAVNVHEALGLEVRSQIEIRRSLVVDARMDPHEWLVTPTGLIKTDGHGHGDDHLYPGPTDVAWDLAGVIVEWRLRPSLAEQFVARFEALAGDAIGRRLAPYLVAYAAFRWGAVSFALHEAGGEEAARLRRVQRYYRARLLAATRAALRSGSLRCGTLPR